MNSREAPRSGFSAYAAELVDKPWGHEEIFATSEGHYVGKTLHVNAGESLSLQYHHAKHETIAVLSGRIRLEVGWFQPDVEVEQLELDRLELGPGEAFDVPAGLVHRMTALDDAVLVETSTADPGWREDVVRLEDRYGRGGSSAP